MQFSDILASTIHDIKNSLSMILNVLEQLTEGNDIQQWNPTQINHLKHETRRANDNLIQLLILYKQDIGQLVPHITEYNLDEFFQEVVAENQSMATSRQVELGYRCEPDLSGYFDADLVRGVLTSALGNAFRYTRDQLLMTAEDRDGWLVIALEDNGRGYPQRMLECQTADSGEGFDFQRTGLGLYFAFLVAALHSNRDRKGFIRIENEGTLGGGRFSLWLP
ncbi:MAG: HAMP domain-containing sensor histidine kinase [Pseudomonadota bacterium]